MILTKFEALIVQFLGEGHVCMIIMINSRFHMQTAILLVDTNRCFCSICSQSSVGVPELGFAKLSGCRCCKSREKLAREPRLTLFLLKFRHLT